MIGEQAGNRILSREAACPGNLLLRESTRRHQRRIVPQHLQPIHGHRIYPSTDKRKSGVTTGRILCLT